MPKKKFSERLALLQPDGRRHYLEFLRNLTPVGFLLSFALFLWLKIDFKKVDTSNSGTTVLFYVFLLSGSFAFYASCRNFYESTFSVWRKWVRMRGGAIRQSQGPHWMFLPKLFKAIWDYQFVETLEVIGTALFLTVPLALVLVVSAETASKRMDEINHRSQSALDKAVVVKKAAHQACKAQSN